MIRKRFLVLILACVLGLCACAPTASPSVTTTTAVPTATTTTTTETLTTTTDTTTEQTTVTSSTTRPSTGKTTRKTTKKTTSTTAKPTTTATKTTAATTTTTTHPAPSVTGEVRAAWVSYIEYNALMQGCKTAQDAKSRIDRQLRTLADNRINTVFWHVRANGDAYYPSQYYKTAATVQKLVDGGFDPLAYAVETAHSLKLQLHAWVNPYRVGFNKNYLNASVTHFQDAKGRYFYLPTDTGAQTLILNGVRELLDKYAIDGVQYDDYFYPEDLLPAATPATFENASYAAYQKSGGTLSVADWRRAGVDSLMAATYTLVQSRGKVFGVSPSHSADKAYNKLYANTRRWFGEAGYVHYLCPQIYFGFEHSTAAFDKVTEQWLSYDRHPSVDLYVGIAMSKIGLKNDQWAGNGKTEWATHNDILKRQVQYLREKGVKGLCFYSASFFEPDTATAGDFKENNDVKIAKQEIQNLLSVL